MLDHRFNHTFKATQSPRWTRSEAQYRSVYGAMTQQLRLHGQATCTSSASIRTWDVGALTIDNNLQRVSIPAAGHTALLGFDYQHVKTDTRGYGSVFVFTC